MAIIKLTLPNESIIICLVERKLMAAKIIIDGYNLIGTAHNDLKAERARLIRDLSNYGRRKGLDVTVVFDGIKDGYNRTRTVTMGLTVIYSGRGESADDVIKEITGAAGVNYIVVSSDRDIVSFAWSKNCTPVRSEDFLQRLYPGNSATMIMYAKDAGNEDDLPTLKKKGNPRVLSKKERSIRQAMDKL
ncbi:MAG: NYN domain-containing protein [Nitrospirae bacterium]|nr:NYN domain-containing protein [Nitrospirota bacterium]